MEHTTPLVLPLPEPMDSNTKHVKLEQQQPQHINLPQLKPFHPMKPQQVYVINLIVTNKMIQRLMEHASNTTKFVINIGQTRSNNILSINIEFIQPQELKSTIILFKMSSLPSISIEYLASSIKTLLSAIFSPSKTIYIWNDIKLVLQMFIYHFGSTELKIEDLNIVQLQEPFKCWYNKIFKHKETCPVPSFDITDSDSCTCFHRPY